MASPLTLSWDATTVSGSHINEVHVSRAGSNDHIENYTIQVEELGGGTALDYSSHICRVINDVANVYGEYTSTSSDAMFQSLTSQFGAYMTDRCAVNDAAARLLQDAFRSELLSLKCLVHSLDTISSAARQSLRQLETVHGISTKTFGKECAAANVLLALITLRFKAGSGDPQGMTKYFQEQNIPTGLLVRYVGNRMHILFHLAAIVYAHMDVFLNFLNPKNGRDSALKKALLEDLSNDFIVTEFQALGLLGKLITGPWMSSFYRDGKHMNAIPKLQKSFEELNLFCQSPEKFKSTTRDIFGGDPGYRFPHSTTDV